MKKRFTPKLLINYLIREFSFSLLIFFGIFLSLILLSTYIEEIIFFKEKEITGNFFIKIFILTLIKTPTILLNLSPFIFLFSGIFFFVKLLRTSEVTPLSLSGFSNLFIAMVPAFYSFLLGIILVFVLSPISSELSRYYESVKQKYSSNDNLIIMSNTGIWVKEKKGNEIFIIRANQIKDQNFENLENVTIYKFNKNNNFYERIDGKKVNITQKEWNFNNATKISKEETIDLKNYKHLSEINLGQLKSFFNNSNVFSIWNILEELKQIRQRGYFGQELVIMFNKYLSLPFLLFAMITLSTIFTLRTGLKFNNFIYIFFGVLAGILVHFLGDLSMALGKSGKIPLVLSVWIPVIIIMSLSMFSLLRENE